MAKAIHVEIQIMENGKAICTVCSYVYSENTEDESLFHPTKMRFEQLPEDWRCPGCGSSRDMFQPLDCVPVPLSVKPERNFLTGASRGSDNPTELSSKDCLCNLISRKPESKLILDQLGINYSCGEISARKMPLC